jgi:hypothetical protein
MFGTIYFSLNASGSNFYIITLSDQLGCYQLLYTIAIGPGTKAKAFGDSDPEAPHSPARHAEEHEILTKDLCQPKLSLA